MFRNYPLFKMRVSVHNDYTGDRTIERELGTGGVADSLTATPVSLTKTPLRPMLSESERTGCSLRRTQDLDREQPSTAHRKQAAMCLLRQTSRSESIALPSLPRGRSESAARARADACQQGQPSQKRAPVHDLGPRHPLCCRSQR